MRRDLAALKAPCRIPFPVLAIVIVPPGRHHALCPEVEMRVVMVEKRKEDKNDRLARTSN